MRFHQIFTVAKKQCINAFFFTLFLGIFITTAVYAAISWPTTPSGETAGGKFASVLNTILNSGDWKNPWDGKVKNAASADKIPFEWFSYCTTGIAVSNVWQTISVPTLIYNTFSGTPYNTSNSTFTAPKAGYYAFNLGGYSPTAWTGERYALGFWVDGNLERFGGWSYSSGDTPMEIITHTTHLNAGSTVIPRLYSAISATIGGPIAWGHTFCFQGRFLGQ